MKFASSILIIGLLGAIVLIVCAEQQRIIRRVIKSTPTATNLARVKQVTVRSVPSAGLVERGAVAEISGKEAAAFGKRSANETNTQQPDAQAPSAYVKSKSFQPSSSSSNRQQTPSSSSSSPTTTTTTTTTSPAPSSSVAVPSSSSSSTTTSAPSTPKQTRPKASDRLQNAAATTNQEVELLASAPSTSWQTMMAVEAPAAALIAAGTRPAPAVGPVTNNGQQQSSSSSDLSSSSSEETNDYLRAASSKTNYASQSVGETFSRLRQQSSKTSQQQQQQQTFYYPQQRQELRAQGKTSNYQATKTNWYQQPTTSTTTTTTPRPAPIYQQQEQQQYEQQVEQLVEGPAPAGQAEPFAFDFRTQDNSGNGQYRKEESDNNGVVHGSYGYTDANGIYRHVEYVADHNGFRAKINSNEPGLIGETQPASIKLDSGPAPSGASQRFSAAPNNYNNVNANNNNNDGSEWSAASSSSNERADLAVAPPDFESAHRSERLQRAPRNFRN